MHRDWTPELRTAAPEAVPEILHEVLGLRSSAEGGPKGRPDSRSKHWGRATAIRKAHSRRPCLGVAPVSYTHLTLPTICSV
eukprot:4278435-Alexandrium_andersonii.AAC.1